MSIKPTSNSANEVSRELLIEGARSFLNAFNALAEFRREVQRCCKGALLRKIEDMNEAMGLRLSIGDFVPYGTPRQFEDGKTTNINGVSAVIGQRIIIQGIGGLVIYVYLDESDPHQSPGIGISMFFEKSEILDSFSQILEPVGVLREGKEISVARHLIPEKMLNLENELSELINEWIRCCHRAEGLCQLVQTRTKSD
jgi:hypothetical protein